VKENPNCPKMPNKSYTESMAKYRDEDQENVNLGRNDGNAICANNCC
jgi:hypothetical protein